MVLAAVEELGVERSTAAPQRGGTA
jgi:hypothetical protein